MKQEGVGKKDLINIEEHKKKIMFFEKKTFYGEKKCFENRIQNRNH